MFSERIPCRFIGYAADAFMVVGISFKSEQSSKILTGLERFDFRFKIGDIDKPINILPFLHISEQRILN